VEGLYGAFYLGKFFLLFALQAVLLSGTALLLRSSPTQSVRLRS
jgi:hypothetical protein